MDKTLVKGLGLLERLARSHEPKGISELASELGLVQSNVHRLLQTLMHCGYVLQEPVTRRYHCTMRLWELGIEISDRLDLRHIARPHMQALAEHSQETVHLSILDGADALYMDKIDSPQPVRSYTRIGGRSPAYCVATGKSLLAHCSNLAAALPPKLTKFTPKTIASLPALKRELAQIQQLGYSVNRGEWRVDVFGIAAPLFDATGSVPAAIGISGPAARMGEEALAHMQPMLQQAAQAISRELGHRPR